MNIDIGDQIFVQIGGERIRATVVQFINNDNILVNLLEHSLLGKRTILVSLSDIVAVSTNPMIDNRTTTNHQIIPTSLSSEREYIRNNIRNNYRNNIRNNYRNNNRISRNTRNKRLKQKRSKRILNEMGQ
jgi:hypothetical protein